MSGSTYSAESELASTLALEIRTVAGKLKRRLREHGEELPLVNPVGIFGPVLGADYAPSILLGERIDDLSSIDIGL